MIDVIYDDLDNLLNKKILKLRLKNVMCEYVMNRVPKTEYSNEFKEMVPLGKFLKDLIVFVKDFDVLLMIGEEVLRFEKDVECLKFMVNFYQECEKDLDGNRDGIDLDSFRSSKWLLGSLVNRFKLKIESFENLG